MQSEFCYLTPLFPRFRCGRHWNLEITSSYEQRCDFSMQFSFQHLLPFCRCHLFPLNFTIDFKLIFNRFCNFYNLVTDICMDGWLDRWIEQWTDRQNNGRTDQWMDGHATYVHRHAIYMYRHARKNDFSVDFEIFTKASRTNQPTNGPIDQRTDGPTDQRMDIPSYRDAIAASKNL